jgi:hypothetical protein
MYRWKFLLAAGLQIHHIASPPDGTSAACVFDSTATGFPYCGPNHPNNRLSNIVSSLKNNSFGKLYPNPNNGNMQYDYSMRTGSTGELKIYDITGQLLETYILKTGINSLNIDQSHLSNGIYVYSVKVDGQIIEQNKIVVIK